MQDEYDIDAILGDWNHILGTSRHGVSRYPERELWLITAEGGRDYYLKRLGPWRNLPLANEARVLRFLAGEGVHVAEFIPTDKAKIHAGEIDDSFVLMPRLQHDHFTAREILAREEEIGALVAKLHIGLAKYPRSVKSYTEDLESESKCCLRSLPHFLRYGESR